MEISVGQVVFNVKPAGFPFHEPVSLAWLHDGSYKRRRLEADGSWKWSGT